MAQPGQKNWWDMTGGELESFNRDRCANLPFGGRGDATCADFSIESLGLNRDIMAQDTDVNRTSEPGTNIFNSPLAKGIINIIPGGQAGLALGTAAGTGAKTAIDTYLPNIVLILIGIVSLIGGLMLWGRFSGDPIAKAGRSLAAKS